METISREESYQGQQARTESQETEENSDVELELKYGAQNLLQLMVPVTICMILVVANILSIDSFGANQGAYLPYTPFHEEGDLSAGTKLGQAVLNTIIVIAIFTAMTFLVVLLYYYECYLILYGYLFFASVMLLAFLGLIYVAQVVTQANAYVDLISVSILLWNTTWVGLLSIYWRSPLLTQQLALLFSCVMVSSIFLQYLPVWTTWVLLGGMAVYDLAAVLCKYGPLNLLVNISQTRDNNVFLALVYSTVLVNTVSDEEKPVAAQQVSVSESVASGATDTTTDCEAVDVLRERLPRLSEQEGGEEEEEASGAKLGLGDFIFYSILVGRATIDSNGDWNIILGCVLSILIGLALTLLLLAIFKHALPALPISIALGLVTYFASIHAITPFTDSLGSHQAFI